MEQARSLDDSHQQQSDSPIRRVLVLGAVQKILGELQALEIPRGHREIQWSPNRVPG